MRNIAVIGGRTSEPIGNLSNSLVASFFFFVDEKGFFAKKNAREDKDDRPAKQRIAQNLDEAAPRLTASSSQSVGFFILDWTAFCVPLSIAVFEINRVSGRDSLQTLMNLSSMRDKGVEVSY